jgi:hypothetical protein
VEVATFEEVDPAGAVVGASPTVELTVGSDVAAVATVVLAVGSVGDGVICAVAVATTTRHERESERIKTLGPRKPKLLNIVGLSPKSDPPAQQPEHLNKFNEEPQ